MSNYKFHFVDRGGEGEGEGANRKDPKRLVE